MARPAEFSSTPSTQVRRHFGLDQATLAGKLRRANDRKDNLTDRNQARTGATAFLADVDAEQVAAQVATLTSAQAAVTTHKAALPA